VRQVANLLWGNLLGSSKAFGWRQKFASLRLSISPPAFAFSARKKEIRFAGAKRASLRFARGFELMLKISQASLAIPPGVY